MQLLSQAFIIYEHVPNNVEEDSKDSHITPFHSSHDAQEPIRKASLRNQRKEKYSIDHHTNYTRSTTSSKPKVLHNINPYQTIHF